MGFRPLLGMVLVRNSFLKVLLTVREYICLDILYQNVEIVEKF